MDPVERFKQAKKTITALAEKKTRIEAQKELKLADLLKHHGVATIEEAEKLQQELLEKVEEQEKDIKKLSAELEDIVEKAEKD